MRVVMYANHEIDTGVNNEVHISQNEVEYLDDFAELLFQFTRAAGYNYVKGIIIVKDNNEEVATQ